ncbi:MAG: HPr family phosphocarrier protein [Desulfohalobiaceae bacterium]
MEHGEAEKEVFVRNELGLHARPAAQLAQEAGRFASHINLIMDGMEVNAKSVLDILSLAAAPGRSVVLRALGPDAEKAVTHLEKFFQDGFGEG